MRFDLLPVSLEGQKPGLLSDLTNTGLIKGRTSDEVMAFLRSPGSGHDTPESPLPMPRLRTNRATQQIG